ncbi:hypothetical protein [Nonomuraea sp. NPDC049158]|uniref:hypothetical protein n=1 Tax=Nonomuraea sp. NPDC049158 TaxID=3155649 RepID=UPI003406BBC6
MECGEVGQGRGKGGDRQILEQPDRAPGKRELKDRVEAYAVLIRDLTERLDAVQRERDDALGELDRIRSGVVVLAERRRGTQRDA